MGRGRARPGPAASNRAGSNRAGSNRAGSNRAGVGVAPGAVGGSHAPAQPRLVLSRSLATEATLLIRSDCCASACAPAIVMRSTAAWRSSASSGSIAPRGLQPRDHRVESARAEPHAHGLRHVLGDGVAVLQLGFWPGQPAPAAADQPIGPARSSRCSPRSVPAREHVGSLYSAAIRYTASRYSVRHHRAIRGTHMLIW